MKHLALAIAAVFTLSLVGPVFAQPFADVPADHWAFDAIAELAAKGILEGYPDGTFKGDRAMTRYEMAMALARILARIEAVQKSIPPPVKIPPPEVRRADIDRLQRLLNEFRAELSALGVRITAIEEDLSALRARLDNTFITGDWTYVYVTGGLFTSGSPEVQRNRIRLTFRGRVANDFTVFLRARWDSRFFGTHSTVISFDRLRTDWVSPWAMTFSVGLEYWTLGPQGYLLGILTSREGMRVTGSFGGIGFTALGFWNSGGAGSKTYGVRATLPAIAGWKFGINYRRDQHLFIPTSPLNGNGFSVDWEGTLIAGFTLTGEYASWSPTGGCPVVVGVVGNGCTALFANLAINLGQVAGVSQFAPTVNVFYKDVRLGYAIFCGATTCTNALLVHQANWLGGYVFTGQTWGADLRLQLTSRLAALVAFETGTLYGLVPGTSFQNTLVRGTYTLSRNATAEVEYARLVFGTATPITGAAFRVAFSW
jgi:hypothetical protein